MCKRQHKAEAQQQRGTGKDCVTTQDRGPSTWEFGLWMLFHPHPNQDLFPTQPQIFAQGEPNTTYRTDLWVQCPHQLRTLLVVFCPANLGRLQYPSLPPSLFLSLAFSFFVAEQFETVVQLSFFEWIPFKIRSSN
jgi:hypothetical protein